MPRLGYAQALAQLDEYLYATIRQRRQRLAAEPSGEETGAVAGDLLTQMLRVGQMDDDLIRDQLLTMLIAGHDTSTALLAWALHLMRAAHRVGNGRRQGIRYP